ncbi:hypothetical protein OKW21_006216 [Catalinimonas alkaloidigena]|uniref:hypothetical protein n=1 Tax=Catalinimonas alkaloidigena TaxID=1075417 RepID=UPI00240617C3|nr:hypothetical protein [Catalinimonas alkaloidigena]MDF9800953.1 hypothetical protein [Catalinimonas alkaloidigena]
MTAIKNPLYYYLILCFSAVSQFSALAQSDLQTEPERPSKPPTDWLLEPTPYQADVYQTNRPDELALSNGLIRRTFRIAPNVATVAFDNLMTGEAMLRGVKPEAEITLNGIEYAVGGLQGQPNYAYLHPEWLDQMRNDPASLQFVRYAVSEPEAPFNWKRVRHHDKSLEWPPEGVHLRMDYRLPEAEDLRKSGQLLPSDYGREELVSTNFKFLDDAWKTVASRAHPRSSFVNEGKVGEIYTPAHSSVFVERELSENTQLVEAKIDAGTDTSSGWGPGIALVWPEQNIKFYLRPGGDEKGSTQPVFGLWDGEETHTIQGKETLELSAPWTLRLRWDQDSLYCEVKGKSGIWQSLKSIKGFRESPTSVRVGKMNPRGEEGDKTGDTGELVRLHILQFAAYSGDNGGSAPQAESQTQAIKVSVHYELYDGLPVMAKWITVDNTSSEPVIVDHFTSEIIAAVEYGSAVEARKYLPDVPNIHVETDYAFASFDVEDANHHAVHWQADPDYNTQVNYLMQTPCLLKVHPEIGPAQRIAAGESFSSFRTFVLPHDSYDRERKGLALRRMYRTLAPWTTENPLMMHARFADWERVKKAIDQSAEVGFEMVILTFGSGFDIENDSQEYMDQMRKYADYAKSKGVEIGGYSLLASRSIGSGQDVVMPEGQQPTFGNSPCIGSRWGQQYFDKLYRFYEKTDFSLLEHDGSYPGDVCMSAEHPGHKGYEDSRWSQYQVISKFYRWCRSQGIYLNVPDYYYMTGSNKCGMGYREVNWSLPRSQQLIHTRQNIYDGTWTKQSSMGWMFVPLTEYHGGGEAATIEPLHEHLSHYQSMIASNLGGGVQACYRGPRLFDTDETKTMVKQWVGWYKAHRAVLEGDIIHLRRADGRDIDYWLNVNPGGEEKGLLSVYNPLDSAIKRKIYVPLYYTGLKETALVKHGDQEATAYPIDRDYGIWLEVEIPAQGYSWYVIK